MAKSRKKRPEAELNMTPMIDIVFQLIIFFIVTITIQKEYNREIELAMSPHGPPVEGKQSAMIIEVNKRGWISMHGAQMKKNRLRNHIIRRYRRERGEFPVLIRADRRTPHKHVRTIMDMCTDVGIWRISFAAIQEKKM